MFEPTDNEIRVWAELAGVYKPGMSSSWLRVVVDCCLEARHREQEALKRVVEFERALLLRDLEIEIYKTQIAAILRSIERR